MSDKSSAEVIYYITIIDEAKKLCEKFVDKVESGRARSKETYKECKALLRLINSI